MSSLFTILIALVLLLDLVEYPLHPVVQLIPCFDNDPDASFRKCQR